MRLRSSMEFPITEKLIEIDHVKRVLCLKSVTKIDCVHRRKWDSIWFPTAREIRLKMDHVKHSFNALEDKRKDPGSTTWVLRA